MSIRGSRSTHPSSWRIRIFPACSSGRTTFTLHDEIYQMKDFSRDKVRVLMRLDACKLDLTNPRCIAKTGISP